MYGPFKVWLYVKEGYSHCRDKTVIYINGNNEKNTFRVNNKYLMILNFYFKLIISEVDCLESEGISKVVK